jgi:hypothetical protein
VPDLATAEWTAVAAFAGGMTEGKIGLHGSKVRVQRPRVRSRVGHELQLPGWRAAQAEDWLGRWATNLMLINVSRRCNAATATNAVQ